MLSVLKSQAHPLFLGGGGGGCFERPSFQSMAVQYLHSPQIVGWFQFRTWHWWHLSLFDTSPDKTSLMQFSGPRNTGSKLTLTGLPEMWAFPMFPMYSFLCVPERSQNASSYSSCSEFENTSRCALLRMCCRSMFHSEKTLLRFDVFLRVTYILMLVAPNC